MINRVFKGSRGILTTLTRRYGELTYVNHMKVQSEFDHVPTFRAIDL